MRILMVTHMRWCRSLGGPRVQLELAEELARLGCTVEKFDVDDAFAKDGIDRWKGRFASAFAGRAKAFVMANGDHFDVIDAHQFNLPFSKHELGFRGVLVMRSVGLLPLYLDFAREAPRMWPKLRECPAIRGLPWRIDRWRMQRQFAASAAHADLINVPNQSESAWIQERYPGKRTVIIPLGMSAERRASLAQVRGDARERLVNPMVVSIASWEPRKGSADWPSIVRHVRSRVEGVRFRFIGTGVDRARILAQLGVPDDGSIDVVPRFESEQLPDLLRGGTVGAFPSYLDGFGYGVIEMLAAGIPTMAYAIPGPGDIVGRIEASWVVPPGNAESIAARIAAVLAADPAAFDQLSSRCVQSASGYALEDIARQTLSSYRDAAVAAPKPPHSGS